MKIFRDGIEILLTKSEVEAAWEEQEHRYIVEELHIRLADHAKERGWSKDKYEELIRAGVEDYNDSMAEDCGEEWSMDHAVEYVMELAESDE